MIPLLLLSFLLVAFGQPAWFPPAGLIASLGGYALFWKGMLLNPAPLKRFFLALVWFMAVHAVQLSWMSSTHYMGPLILVVYACLLLGLGIQFALFSSLLDPKKQLSLFGCAALAGGFVLLEGMRLYLLTGFTWNPAGLSLASNRYSIQLAALLGVYGLSFWVIFTNLSALTFFQTWRKKQGIIWASLALFPYVFGGAYETYIKRHFHPDKQISALLIGTALTVEEKARAPLQQWEKIWSYIDKPVDLIVLPEAALPYGADTPYCTLEQCQSRFGDESAFPPLEPPYAFPYGKQFVLTNTFFAQMLSNQFNADLIIGLDSGRKNAAFLFRPHQLPERYDKRILAPVGEYIPLSHIQWISDFLALRFGIINSFEAGQEAKVFASHVPIGVPICLEETHGELVRDLRKRGAKLLVSLSNDVWFPSSKLARQHFDLGRMRAVENGVYLLRSSNMGVSGGVDCFGQTIDTIAAGALHLSIPVFSTPTPFSYFGNRAIFLFSGALFFLFLLKKLLRNAPLR